LLEGAEESHEKLQSEEPVFRPRSEPRTSRIRNRTVNHLTKVFRKKVFTNVFQKKQMKY
jgi:hypothetical protein